MEAQSVVGEPDVALIVEATVRLELGGLLVVQDAALEVFHDEADAGDELMENRVPLNVLQGRFK